MAYEEREIKLYVQNLEVLAERLRICGGELVQPRVFERNVRLDTPDRSLQAVGQLLRLRQDDQVRVTYKANAHMEDGVITRTEIEFSADDADAVRKLFEALGYQEVVVYEKYRRVYQLGDVQVMLDELPFGNFVEIEAPNNTLIEGMIQMLSLDGTRSINTNYLGLWNLVRQRTGLAFNDLTFENLDGVTLTAADLGVLPADHA